jgi:hypothetical protein
MKFQPSRLLISLLAGAFLSCSGRQALAVAPLTLQSGFLAAFGHTSPMRRNVRSPSGRLNYMLHPLLLVRLSGTHAALIVAEDTDDGNAYTGAVAVAYLTWRSNQWRLFRVWYEFIQTGSFGTAFLSYREFHYGNFPLFVGESENSGTGAVTTWYNLIGLSPNGPLAWGFIHAEGAFNSSPDGLRDGDGDIGCGGYAYSSSISAPTKSDNLMEVTYRGWMLPGGQGQKRHEFLISAEVATKKGRLSLQPAPEIPNCGD